MSDSEFLQVQTHELARLLEEAGDDPVLAPQLRERLADAQHELEAASRGQLFAAPLPRAAIFMRGGGVTGSKGMKPSMAGEALIQYERMFIEQAMHDERAAARTAGRERRPRGTPKPQLLFTGTPRGSFGLEFVPQSTEEHALDELHVQSLRHLANALALAAGGDMRAIKAGIPARVLNPLKQFMKALADNGAELRLAFSDQASTTFDSQRIRTAAEALDREVREEMIDIIGVFRGLTFESGYFDFNPDDGGTVTGTVANNLSMEDLQRIDALTNHRCKAFFQKTTILTVSGADLPTYILVDAQPIE